MGFLRSGSTKTSITKYSGLQVQTTSSALPIPLVYGAGKLAPNCFWYNNFQAIPQYSGGKGGGKGGGGGGKGVNSPSSYNYKCAIMLGLCEGPITGIGNVWTTSTTPVALSATGLSLAVGVTPQPTWSYLTSAYPAQALNYAGIAYLYAPAYALGQSASVGDNNFEVKGVLFGSGVTPSDADPAQMIYDFLTNSQYGVGLSAAAIDAGSLFGGSGGSSYQTFCWAAGLALSPVMNSTETAASILDRWLKLTNSTCVWSSGKLKFLPFGDSSLTGGNGTVNQTWVPNLTPLYNLTDEDFVYSDGEDPVKITRIDPYTVPNQQSLEIQARTDNYNSSPITVFDQAAINRFGLRVGSTISAHEICDIGVGQRSAQLILQRELYIRNTYEFRLSQEFCLLDPMDLVTLTDAAIGLTANVVRITDIEETDDGTLNIKAEEFPQGVASAVAYPTQTKSNGSPDSSIAAPAVNTPLIIEPSPSLTNGVVQLWIGASGAGGSLIWGGCIVWASLDATSYAQVSKIAVRARQGVLTAVLPTYAGAGIDNTNTLSVDLTQSAGILQSTSSASAATGITLCYVDGEYLAYTTATLTAVGMYNLTGLYRGMNGSVVGSHAIGKNFCLLDIAILKYNVPTIDIGQTIYLKFQSYNVFGGGVQDISTCVAYPYLIQGAGNVGPVVAALLLGTPMDFGHIVGETIAVNDDYGSVTGAPAFVIDLGNCLS